MIYLNNIFFSLICGNSPVLKCQDDPFIPCGCCRDVWSMKDLRWNISVNATCILVCGPATWYPSLSYWFHHVWILKWDQASILGHSRGSRIEFWIPSFLKICRQGFTNRFSLYSPGYAYWLDQIWGLKDN